MAKVNQAFFMFKLAVSRKVLLLQSTHFSYFYKYFYVSLKIITSTCPHHSLSLPVETKCRARAELIRQLQLFFGSYVCDITDMVFAFVLFGDGFFFPLQYGSMHFGIDFKQINKWTFWVLLTDDFFVYKCIGIGVTYLPFIRFVRCSGGSQGEVPQHGQRQQPLRGGCCRCRPWARQGGDPEHSGPFR